MARTEKATALQTEIDTLSTRKRIYTLRGRQVMLDQDLAEIYEVETKVLKQAVRRNIERLPEDFMWLVTEDELENLKSQFVTQNVEKFSEADAKPNFKSQSVTQVSATWSVGRHGRFAPFAFTEHGIAMLSSVLQSRRAIQVNIGIIRIFIQLRNEPRSHLDVGPQLESLESMFAKRFDRLEERLQNQAALNVALPSLPTNHNPTSKIQETVARHFGVSSEDLKSALRTQSISLPRHIAIYLVRKHLRLGFTEIGKYFGGRDHSTVLHAYRKILADVETNTMIRMAVDTLGNEIAKMLT